MIIMNPAINGDSESWKLVDAKRTNSGDISVEFDGLQGDKDHTYKIICLTHLDIVGETRLRINDDSGANYRHVYMSVGGTLEVSTQTETEFPFNSLNSTPEQVISEVIISARSGVTSGHIIKSEAGTNGSGGDIHRRAGNWSSTAEITKLSIYANLGTITIGRFGDGCVFELYKMASQ